MFQIKFVEKIKIQFLCSITFLFFFNFQNRALFIFLDNVETFCRAGLAADGNMALAHCMLGTQVNNHNTPRLCNTRGFSTATMFARTLLIVSYTYIACIVTNTFIMKPGY